MSGNYEDLAAWQKGMNLVLEIYTATRRFPKEETYGLSSQMRRASVSVPSNIAEGKGRSSDKELLVFLSHARGSLCELETQIFLAEKLQYLRTDESKALIVRTRELGRILNGLISSMRAAVAGN